MKTKIVKVISLIICIVLICAILSSCALIEALLKYAVSNIKINEYEMKTTDDGFKYYVDQKIGVCILEFPQTEEVVVPEYIKGRKVVQFGYFTPALIGGYHYSVVGQNTKELTIQHQFDIYNDDYDGYHADFPNLTNLTFIDFLYCYQSYEKTELIVPHYIGNKTTNVPIVELKKSDREYSLENFKATVIYIPDYVKVIEAGVFDKIEGVTIKTSYETKPEGWEDGWNGSCEVVWGEEITYLYYYDYIKETSGGYSYYYNENTEEGVYLLGVPNQSEVTIPEYIDGKRVVEFGHKFGDVGRIVYGEHVFKLTIQHQFKVYENIDPFRCLNDLIFIDFLYCFQCYEKEELIVPCSIGNNSLIVPSVELKKSDREYSLEDFKAKVIIIPKYVRKIDAGVFDGLDGVIIKTPYETKPEGWQDGWNGTCEVVWGIPEYYA